MLFAKAILVVSLLTVTITLLILGKTIACSFQRDLDPCVKKHKNRVKCISYSNNNRLLQEKSEIIYHVMIFT